MCNENNLKFGKRHGLMIEIRSFFGINTLYVIYRRNSKIIIPFQVDIEMS